MMGESFAFPFIFLAIFGVLGLVAVLIGQCVGTNYRRREDER